MTKNHLTLSNLQLLKLGGSLITDKNRPHTPRLEVIQRLADEIAQAYLTKPGLRLILGHGSGSFGHVPASQYGTRQGVHNTQQWQGFVEVWREAWGLNRLVMDALGKAGLPAVALSPLASVMAEGGDVLHWNMDPLNAALEAGLLPVLYGDVVFDVAQGGTILSTEDLFVHVCNQLSPQRLLLAGIEPGVWADYPSCTHILRKITPHTLQALDGKLSGAASVDVTGGMASKVEHSLALAQQFPDLEIRIFSGASPDAVLQVLLGAEIGTLISTL